MGKCQKTGLLQTMLLVCAMEGGSPMTRLPHAVAQAGLRLDDPGWNAGG